MPDARPPARPKPSRHPAADLPEWADPQVPVGQLDAQGVSRRGVLRSAGLLGSGLVAGGVGVAVPAAATPPERGRPDPELMWLVGDHHVHSRYSSDAKYDVSQQAYRGAQFGPDWMVLTAHSNAAHASKGAAAEHATVFVAPGPREVALLTEFETRFDGNLLGRTQGAVGDPATAANEALAVEAIRWLGEQRRAKVVDDVLVLANHPSRLGIDSPHELRGWRDADPEVAIGMEGAPGHRGRQALAHPDHHPAGR